MRYCDPTQICRQQCAQDRDCPSGVCNVNGQCVGGTRPDAGLGDVVDASPGTPDGPGFDGPTLDAGTDVETDLGPVETDTGVDVPGMDVGVDIPIMDAVGADVLVASDTGVDIGPPPMDVPPPLDTGTDGGSTGRGVYLDPCTLPTDCASGFCYADGAGNRFCSHACASQLECGGGYQCITGHCVSDDTGAPCSAPSTTCHYGCFTGGTPANSQCTHFCNTGGDCPAGYACSGAGATHGPPYVCMQIEIPDTAGCPGGLYSADTGCTARCRTAMDCPTVFQSLVTAGATYTCVYLPAVGASVCVPPTGVVGSAPMGATCAATGLNTCRSESCDTSVTPPVCVQACTERGGCPLGWGCKPESNSSGSYDFVCRPAGSTPLGGACARGSDCVTAMCQSTSTARGYCTRLCGEDGHCPTRMTCTDAHTLATDGTPISICTLP